MAGDGKRAAAKSIMVQGTMSNAGKSLLAAGLCRVFAQDGYRVAPFKAQNMALNSFVTEDGLEMGRAQVMQAEAAGREPDVRMNPVLLKPTGDTGSQIIVNGEVAGNMTAAEYYEQKRRIVPVLRAAYESLEAENDVIVLEGAGSPAEINLKEHDIVNMFMAKLARAPVLLAGDIDRGGVFASLYGTVMLLPEDERALIKGVVVNKFRGDAALLRPGLSMLEDLVHIPVLGVVPYLRLDLDDEDSLSGRLTAAPKDSLLDIAVVRLPRISNFTDFNALSLIEEASVRYVDSPRNLGEPDLLILPGTKNTMGDLKWLRRCGLEAAILRYAAGGGPLVGICGGYQMLCRRLRDPEAVEEGGELAGLGLLDAETVFEPRKVRTRVGGRLLAPGGALSELAGAEFAGYEIHMGRTFGAPSPLAELLPLRGEAKTDGMACGSVYGCYVHGLFDSAAVLRALGRALLRRKGLGGEVALRAENLGVYKQRQYDLLADALRAALDMRAVYRILEEGV